MATNAATEIEKVEFTLGVLAIDEIVRLYAGILPNASRVIFY